MSKDEPSSINLDWVTQPDKLVLYTNDSNLSFHQKAKLVSIIGKMGSDINTSALIDIIEENEDSRLVELAEQWRDYPQQMMIAEAITPLAKYGPQGSEKLKLLSPDEAKEISKLASETTNIIDPKGYLKNRTPSEIFGSTVWYTTDNPLLVTPCYAFHNLILKENHSKKAVVLNINPRDRLWKTFQGISEDLNTNTWIRDPENEGVEIELGFRELSKYFTNNEQVYAVHLFNMGKQRDYENSSGYPNSRNEISHMLDQAGFPMHDQIPINSQYSILFIPKDNVAYIMTKYPGVIIKYDFGTTNTSAITERIKIKKLPPRK